MNTLGPVLFIGVGIFLWFSVLSGYKIKFQKPGDASSTDASNGGATYGQNGYSGPDKSSASSGTFDSYQAPSAGGFLSTVTPPGQTANYSLFDTFEHAIQQGIPSQPNVPANPIGPTMT